MKIEDLTLTMIDGQRHLTTSDQIVTAVAYAARRGFSNVTCSRFVTALVMTDMLRDAFQWPFVLKKIDELRIELELAALKDNRVVTGPIE